MMLLNRTLFGIVLLSIFSVNCKPFSKQNEEPEIMVLKYDDNDPNLDIVVFLEKIIDSQSNEFNNDDLENDYNSKTLIKNNQLVDQNDSDSNSQDIITEKRDAHKRSKIETSLLANSLDNKKHKK